MIKVPRDQGNVDVAALAYGLSVVERFRDSKPAGMSLHRSGYRIQIPRAGMRSERLPLRKSVPRSLHRSIDVSSRALSNLRELFCRCRIIGGEEHAFRRLLPLAADEVPEASAMMIQPAERFLRVLRRGTVFHGEEFFSDAHGLSVPAMQSDGDSLPNTGRSHG